MNFEEKVEVEVLVADRDPKVSHLLEESDASPLLLEQPGHDPLPDHSTIDKPDQTALAAWVDDLAEFEQEHIGDDALFHAAEKLKAALADDVSAADRERMHDDITVSDEQHGMIGNFLADTAIEGAAVDVHEPNAAKEEAKAEADLLVSTATRTLGDGDGDDDDALFGEDAEGDAIFGGGGGGGPPIGGGGGGDGGWPGDDGADDAPDSKDPKDPKGKTKAKAKAGAPDKDKDKDAAKPAPAPASTVAKPHPDGGD